MVVGINRVFVQGYGGQLQMLPATLRIGHPHAKTAIRPLYHPYEYDGHEFFQKAHACRVAHTPLRRTHPPQNLPEFGE